MTITVSGTSIGIYPRQTPDWNAPHSSSALSDQTQVDAVCYRHGVDVAGPSIDSDLWFYAQERGFLPVAYTDTDPASVLSTLPPCDEGISVPISPQQNVVHQYDRTAVVAYADAHWNSGRRIPWAPDCTVYTSDSVAQSIPQDSIWSSSSTDVNQVASRTGSLFGRIPSPTKTYADANLFVHYLLDQGYATVTPVSLNQNMVPDAQPGDVIAYAWSSGGGADLPLIDHLAIVVGNDGSQTKVDQHEGPAHWKGWNWSSSDNDWILNANPAATAYLIHIVY